MIKPGVITEQGLTWKGQFGQDYTDRNAISLEQEDAIYEERYGISRTDLNYEFLVGLPIGMKVLEVGCNIGSQLLYLQRMGMFPRLYGIDIQPYAVELSKSGTKNINIIIGSALSIPFKDNYFGLVFTSGLLVHIHPRDINLALDEIYRCSEEYIWGYEYFGDAWEEIPYRGERELLWRANYPQLFLDRFPNLVLVKRTILEDRIFADHKDVMYLMRKK